MNSPAPASRPNLTALIVLAAVVAAFGLWLGMRFANAPAQPKLASALRFVPADRLLPCTNCGMVPLARAVARDKLRALGEGAAIVRRELTS